MTAPKTLSALLLPLVQSGQARNQTQMMAELAKRGVDANQSSVSRALRKIGAVKSLNAAGEAVYRIPSAANQIGSNRAIRDLATAVLSNEQLIMVHTCTGSASVVAQIIDEQNFPELLGTLAGDNSIIVIPKSVRLKAALEKKLAEYFHVG